MESNNLVKLIGKLACNDSFLTLVKEYGAYQACMVVGKLTNALVSRTDSGIIASLATVLGGQPYDYLDFYAVLDLKAPEELLEKVKACLKEQEPT